MYLYNSIKGRNIYCTENIYAYLNIFLQLVSHTYTKPVGNVMHRVKLLCVCIYIYIYI